MNLGNFVPKIKFLRNWNKKLNCDYFYTIRPYSLSKQQHYEDKTGEKFEVYVRGVLVGYARLIHVNASLHLNEIPFEFLVADTGSEDPYAIYSTFGIGKGDKVILLLFRRQGEESNSQQDLQQLSRDATSQRPSA